jgi:hypothetical protein
MRGHPKGVGALIVWFGPGCGCGCGCGCGGRLDVELMRQMVERGTFGLDEMAGLVQFCAGWGSGSVLLLRLFHVAVFLTGGISVMMYSPLSRRDTWSACRRIRMLEAPQRNADTDAWLEATGRELRALEVRLASAREAAAAGGGGVSQRNGHRRSAGMAPTRRRSAGSKTPRRTVLLRRRRSRGITASRERAAPQLRRRRRCGRHCWRAQWRGSWTSWRRSVAMRPTVSWSCCRPTCSGMGPGWSSVSRADQDARSTDKNARSLARPDSTEKTLAAALTTAHTPPRPDDRMARYISERRKFDQRWTTQGTLRVTTAWMQRSLQALQAAANRAHTPARRRGCDDDEADAEPTPAAAVVPSVGAALREGERSGRPTLN